jgi:dihydroorotase
MTQTLTLKRPDDWHVHLRDGAMLKLVLPYTAKVFARAIIMPNLTPPVTSVAAAKAYRERILAALPAGMAFTPLMTLYLTDGADAKDIEDGFRGGVYTAAKLYPAHATTNSAHGVTDIKNIRPALETMQRLGMPLLVHGEVTDPEVDIFDREKIFIEKKLISLLKDFPQLKIVLEHATTREAVDFVSENSAKHPLASTITAHHLHINRNAIFQGGIRPHFYCLPVAKREAHRQALVKAATSGKSCFFLGTDSAPHNVAAKESGCGCAGIFTAPQALELYAEIFDQENALARLEGFASLNGPRFYGLPVNEGSVTLVKKPQEDVPLLTAEDGAGLLPFALNTKRAWTIEKVN